MMGAWHMHAAGSRSKLDSGSLWADPLGRQRRSKSLHAGKPLRQHGAFLPTHAVRDVKAALAAAYGDAVVPGVGLKCRSNTGQLPELWEIRVCALCLLCMGPALLGGLHATRSPELGAGADGLGAFAMKQVRPAQQPLW